MPFKDKEIHNAYCRAYYHNHKEEIKEQAKERYDRRKHQISYYKKRQYWRNKFYHLTRMDKDLIELYTLAELKHECKKIKDDCKC